MATIIHRSIGTRTAYSTGTVAVDATGLIVTLSGGTFNAAWGIGDVITINSVAGRVLSRDGDNQLTLQSAHAEAGNSGLSFSVARAYSTLALWEADTDNDLTSSDTVEKGQCYNDSQFSAGVTIAGATTDSTRYRVLTCPPGQRHDGTKATGASINGAVLIQENYAVFEWMRVTHPSGADYYGTDGVVRLGSGTSPVNRYITVNRIILHDWVWSGSSIVYYNVYGFMMYACGGCAFLNCQAINLRKENNDNEESETAGFAAFYQSAAVAMNYFYNCVVYKLTSAYQYTWTEGITSGWSTMRAYVKTMNCISMITEYEADWWKYDVEPDTNPDSNNNCSGDDLATGDNSLHNVDPADVFLDLTPGSEDLHLKAASPCIGAGYTVTDYPNDLPVDAAGVNRGAGAWDIGAFKYDSGPGPSGAPWFLLQARNQLAYT